jgi:hypothetical protein
MVDRSYGVRQSQFIEETSVPAGSSLGFFNNGYNYQITYANFLSGLGVTGTIVQDGDPAGVPVLDVQGTVNNIRNLEAGSGVSINVSAQNGIEIEHNFTVDSTGEPLMQDVGDPSPTIVSLVAGTGIDIVTSGSTIEISSIEAESYALVSMTGNATVTTIASTATPVKVSGTFTLGDISAGWTGSTNGRITHTGATTRHIINAIVTLDVSSGSNHKISAYIAKNGTIASVKMTETISAGAPRSIATFVNLSLATNDYFEIFVRNESTTDSVIAVNAVLSAL